MHALPLRAEAASESKIMSKKGNWTKERNIVSSFHIDRWQTRTTHVCVCLWRCACVGVCCDLCVLLCFGLFLNKKKSPATLALQYQPKSPQLTNACLTYFLFRRGIIWWTSEWIENEFKRKMRKRKNKITSSSSSSSSSIPLHWRSKPVLGT